MTMQPFAQINLLILADYGYKSVKGAEFREGSTAAKAPSMDAGSGSTHKAVIQFA